jgi:hypothetical protein
MAETSSDTSESKPTRPTASDASDGEGRPEMAHIDVEALAEKVYRLMLAEIRLDRARGLASSDGQ